MVSSESYSSRRGVDGMVWTLGTSGGKEYNDIVYMVYMRRNWAPSEGEQATLREAEGSWGQTDIAAGRCKTAYPIRRGEKNAPPYWKLQLVLEL